MTATSMEFLFTDLFINVSFFLITFLVVALTIFAYRKEVFFSHIAFGTLAYAVLYITALLYRRFSTGHVAEHASSEPLYAFLASMHGTVSLWALVQAFVMFYIAHRAYKTGRNFFHESKTWTTILVSTWILSFVSGFIL